jgi:hypothetical protein
LRCPPSTEACEGCATVAESRAPTPGLEDIGVIIHLMLADIDAPRRQKEYSVDRVWAFAPTADAVKKKLKNVVPGEPNTRVEYWTRYMIGVFFSRNGKVNEIWRDYGIKLTLLRVEDCRYVPGALRPDGLVRDSMPTPQTSTSWTGQLFRSINRLFAEAEPNVLHVFFWWSVAEGDIDDVNAVSGHKETGGNRVWGYSRSAAHGGPAVWVGTHACLTHLRSESIDYYRGRCAKVLAHEVGHALGLHHVDEPATNLMYKDPAINYEKPKKGVRLLSESQEKQARREAREQFGLGSKID